jgi:hypothetical protein
VSAKAQREAAAIARQVFGDGSVFKAAGCGLPEQEELARQIEPLCDVIIRAKKAQKKYTRAQVRKSLDRKADKRLRLLKKQIRLLKANGKAAYKPAAPGASVLRKFRDGGYPQPMNGHSLASWPTVSRPGVPEWHPEGD